MARYALSHEAYLQMVAAYSAGVVADVRELREREALAYEVTPAGLDRNDRRIYLDIHGGALIEGGGAICRMLAVGLSGRLGARVVTVDYRMPPDHPFPAGLDDCLAVYRALLRDHSPKEIMVGGASAGGNIAAAMVLKARDAGLPLPAGAASIPAQRRRQCRAACRRSALARHFCRRTRGCRNRPRSARLL